MGHLKTNKLDNGAIGFECTYGGLEAPFGGIDASKNPRYIDPLCFADASNFLLIDNEICLCTLVEYLLPPQTGIPYPLNSTAPNPGVLLGVGTLPCENVVKNWALYVSPGVDSSGYYTYRLVLWTNDSATIETHDCVIHNDVISFPGTQATATISINYAPSLSTVQSVVTTSIEPLHPFTGGDPTTHTAFDGKYYECFQWNPAVVAPNIGPVYGQYMSNLLFGATTAPGFGNTPASGAVPLPTPTSLASTLVATINGWAAGVPPWSGDPAGRPGLPFTAAIGSGGSNTVKLTATTPTGVGGVSFTSVDGAAGNSINLIGGTYPFDFGYYPNTTGFSFAPIVLAAVVHGYLDPNPFTSPSFVISVTPFSGGRAGRVYTNAPIEQLTWETIGDELFLGGWPAGYLLHYKNSTTEFGYLTQYEGAKVLKKFAGHLISAGVINGLGDYTGPTNFDNPHLWFSWSAEGNFAQWDAIDSAGLVTGAGGAGLADISDMLTGLIVSNSVAFILRAEGLSYAQVQKISALPFEFNHVALSKVGQGCPSTALWTQFDQLGFYVGNSNIFMLTQGPQAIGDKIITALFPQLLVMSNRLTDPPPPFLFAGPADPPAPFADKFYTKVNVEPLTFPANDRIVTQFAINLSGIVYMFDPQYQTWMKLVLDEYFSGEDINDKWHIFKCISLPRNGIMGYDGSYQNKESYIYSQRITSGLIQPPRVGQISPFHSTLQTAHVYFPQEEISFGRDITIDAVYILAAGIPGMVTTVTIDGWQGNPSTFISGAFSKQLVLGADASPDRLIEYQVFNTGGGAITLKAPQLRLTVPPQITPSYTSVVPYPILSKPDLRFSKIAMFGSFDPNQRPV